MSERTGPMEAPNGRDPRADLQRMAITDAGVQLLAALELEQFAFELKRAHTTASGNWIRRVDEPDTKEEHDRLLWLAARLRKIATTKQGD